MSGQRVSPGFDQAVERRARADGCVTQALFRGPDFGVETGRADRQPGDPQAGFLNERERRLGKARAGIVEPLALGLQQGFGAGQARCRQLVA